MSAEKGLMQRLAADQLRRGSFKGHSSRLHQVAMIGTAERLVHELLDEQDGHALPAVAAAGPRAIAMNMAASEGGSLNQAEQLEVIRRSKAAAAGCPIVSGVLSTYTEGAKDVACRVVDAGADGIVVFPALPTFVSKPV